jgi:hypothetical protein
VVDDQQSGNIGWLVVICAVSLWASAVILPVIGLEFQGLPTVINKTTGPFLFKWFITVIFFGLIFMTVLRRGPSLAIPKCGAICTFSELSLGTYTLALTAFALCISLSNIVSKDLPYWREDNGAFIARYVNMYHVLPALSYYDPFWQAGEKTTDFLTSGTLGIGVLFYPFLRPEHIDVTYRYIAPILLLALPTASYFSARLFNLSPVQALCAAFFSFVACPEPGWFLPVVLLRAGMYPYFLTSVLFPVFVALMYRGLFASHKIRYLMLAVVVGLFASAHLTFMFMICGLMTFVLLAWARAIRVSKNIGKKTKLIGVFAVFFSIGMFLIAVTPSEILRQGGHLFQSSIETYRKVGDILAVRPSEIAKQVTEWITPRMTIHLVVLVLGLYQALQWNRIGDRRGSFLLFNFGWLLLLGWFGSFFVAGTQPVRFLTPAGLLLLIPFSYAWTSLTDTIKNFGYGRKDRAVVCSIVFISVHALIFLIPWFYFAKASPSNAVLVSKWVATHCNTEERVFLDLAGHKGLGGQAGRLQQLTGVHFMGEKAFDPERKKHLLEKMAKLFGKEYFNTYAIRYLFLTTSEAQNFAEEVLGLVPTEKLGPIRIYDTQIEPSFFEKGNGQLDLKINEIKLTFSERPPEEVVLRFHYFEGYEATAGVDVFPAKNQFGEEFIGIRTNNNNRVTLRW